MSTPHRTKDTWQGNGRKAGKLAAWMNTVAQWLNLAEGHGGIVVDPTSVSVRIGPDPDHALVPAPPESGFHVLTANDGVMAWRPAYHCDGTEVETP